MESLNAASRELAELVARVEASVVGITSKCRPNVSGVAWSQDLVVTSARAIDQEETLTLNIAGRRVAARRVGIHVPSDLAVLRAEAELSPLPPADEAELAVGELVIALSRPGEGVRVRLGVISALGAAYRLPGGVELSRYIESDIAATPGMNASALVRMNGQLVGVNSSRLSRGALVALPPRGVASVVSGLATHGRVRRAKLGVAVYPVPLPESPQAPRRGAVIVLSVLAGSPAARAGVLQGDVLVALGANSLGSPEELEAALADAPIGTQASLLLLRAGQELRLEVELEERT